MPAPEGSALAASSSRTLERGRLGGLADRLGCTEGQVYSTAILLVGALLLSVLALPNLQWRAAEASPAPARRSATSVPAGGSSVDPGGFAPAEVPPLPDVIEGLLPPADEAATTSTTAGSGEVPVVPVQCGLRAVQDAAADVLVPLDDLLGGIVPSEGALGLLAQATGCTKNQLLVDLIVLVLDVGRGLPNPLGDTPALLPPLPLLPDALVQVLAPALGPLLAPVCESYSTVATVVNLVGDAYPWPVGGPDVGNLLLYLSITCGSLS